MKLNRMNCEKYLYYVIAQIIRSDVQTAAALLSAPALRSMLFQALNVWGLYIACAQGTVVSVCEDAGLTRQEMVSGWVENVFRSGRKEENAYPTLSRFLQVASSDGAQPAVAYLMTSARNYALDVERKHDVRRRRSGEIMGFDEGDEWGVIDPGESCDEAAEGVEEQIIRRQGMNELFSHLGERFLGDVAILSDALGYNRRTVAELIYAGCHVELVTGMVQALNESLHADYAPALEPLMAQARIFVLPDKLKRDFDALLARLYRESSSGARERFARRVGGRP